MKAQKKIKKPHKSITYKALCPLHPARFERTTYGLGIRPGLFLSTCKIRTNIIIIQALMTVLQTEL